MSVVPLIAETTTATGRSRAAPVAIAAARAKAAPLPTEVPPNLITSSLALTASRPTECLIQVAQDVVDGLETDGEPDVVGGDAGRPLLVHGELGVGSRGRVDDQALRVADVREQAVQLQPVYEPLAFLQTTVYPEAEDCAVEPGAVVLAGDLVRGVIREPGIVDPGDPRVILEELGDGHGVLRVALHPERQRLEPLQEEEAVERAQRRAVVPEHLDARLQDKREFSKSGVYLEPMVRGVGLGEPGEATVIPGEAAAVNDHSSYRGPVAADELGRGVDDDVGSVLEGLDEVRGRQRVVHDERDARLVCRGRQSLDVERVEGRVPYGLGEDGLRLVGDGVAVGLRIVPLYVLYLDPDLRQRVVEEVVGAAVELGGRDELVPRPRDVEDRQCLRRLTRGGRKSANALLERGDALLEDVGCGVHDAGVDVAHL